MFSSVRSNGQITSVDTLLREPLLAIGDVEKNIHVALATITSRHRTRTMRVTIDRFLSVINEFSSRLKTFARRQRER